MCTPLTFQVRLKERVPRSLRSCLGPACGAWVRGLGAGSQATPGAALRPISVRATWKLAAEYGHLVSLSEGLQILFLLKGLGPTTIFILLLSF